MASNTPLSSAIAELVAAREAFAAIQFENAERLAAGQARRERALRRVAALGLSHRRIAALSDMSHTLVNQILGAGVEPLPLEAHVAPGLLGPPSTVPNAVIRIMAEEGSRRWTLGQLDAALAQRDWPRVGLEPELVRLTTEGVVLSAADGGFTIHMYAQGAVTG